MRISDCKALIILLMLLTFALPSFSQEIDPALLNRARAAGLSQDQINALIDEYAGQATQQMQDKTLPPAAVVERERIVPEVLFPVDTIVEKENVVFGREIFSTKNLTFEPNYNMPTPAGYVLAGGDEVVINVWGVSEYNASLIITPEGYINIPQVGLVYLNGLKIEDAEQKIKSALKKIMSGIDSQSFVKVTLGQIRSIKVNILGEVVIPGTYTLPSLASLFNAIYSAGGVNDIGSLREVKLYRNNKEIASLDVYNFLLKGIYDSNIRLQDNDVIIVPPYRNIVSVTGQVRRERIFEMRDGETLADLIGYAGGMTGDAYSEIAQVRRKAGKMLQIFTVGYDEFSAFQMNDGDSVVIDKVIEEYSNKLSIRGAVWHPGDYELSEKTNSLSKLINLAAGLKGNEFASRGVINRRKPDYTYEVIQFNVRDVVTGRNDIELIRDDEVYIPTIFDLREEYFLVVNGEVNNPDTLDYKENMTVEDAILQSGGLKESASVERVEVARRIKGQAEYTSRIAEIFTFNITRDLQLSPEASGFTLMPFDEITVRSSPGYKVQSSAMVRGEVLFEGSYVLATNGERLSDLVKNAGGLTPDAYIKGASLRRFMTDDERAKFETLQGISAGSDSVDLGALTASQYYPVGIDLESAIRHPGGSDDVILREGDILYVPKYNEIVKVSGGVLYPNALTFSKSAGLRSYLSKSGGYQNGARKKPYVVYMNGDVASTGSFFGIKNYPKVEPGSEIIVPMKADRAGRTNISEVVAVATTSVSLASVVAMLFNIFR